MPDKSEQFKEFFKAVQKGSAETLKNKSLMRGILIEILNQLWWLRIFVKDRLKDRGVKILESCLLLKQHGIRDISAGFAAISARDSNFTEKRAADLIGDLFKNNPDVPEEEILAV